MKYHSKKLNAKDNSNSASAKSERSDWSLKFEKEITVSDSLQ